MSKLKAHIWSTSGGDIEAITIDYMQWHYNSYMKTTESPRFSMIENTRNVENFYKKCMKSVVVQLFE